MNTIDGLPSKESLLSYSSMSCVLRPLSLNSPSAFPGGRARNPQRLSASALQCGDPSTPLSLGPWSRECIDASTPQHPDSPTRHHLDHSSLHHFEHYHHRHIDASTPQPSDRLEHVYLRGRIEQLKNELAIAGKLKSQLAPLAILSRLEQLTADCQQFRLIVDRQSIEKGKINEEYKARIRDLKAKLEQEKRNSLALANRRQSLVFGERSDNIPSKRNSIHF